MGLLGVGLVGALLFGGATPALAARTVVPAKGAEAKVTKKVPGTVLSTVRTTRDGFRAWAVRVKRGDGSIVVGFVDIASGIIFDWTVQAGPGDPVVDLDGPDKTLEPARPPAAAPADVSGDPVDPGTVADPAGDDPGVPAPTAPNPRAADPVAPPVADDVEDDSADGDSADDDSADDDSADDDSADESSRDGRGRDGSRGDDGRGDDGRGDAGDRGQGDGRGSGHSDSRGRGR
jgi:hypothetical protein